MTFQDDKKRIMRAYMALDFIPELEKCRALALEGERSHRKFNPGPYAATSVLSAHAIALSWIARVVLKRRVFSVPDILHVRDDIMLAAAIAEEYRVRVQDKLGIMELEWLADFDYAKFVRGEPQS